MLRARSAVVVGASPNPSFVSSIFKNLLRNGFTGNVAAVNPRYDSILDAPCYPSVLDVPWPIDLAVVGVSWRLVPDLLVQCEQKHVGALVMITSGYAETGHAGAARQRELTAWSERTGIPICGPNCLGLAHLPSGMMALPSSFATLIPGNLGLILQSGMMAPSLLGPLFARNIGVTFAITSGNEASVDLADYVSYVAADDETHVIGCFAEQIKSPAAFSAACEEAADRRKPIVMLKIGRSEASQKSAIAHTGSLVGSDGVIDAALTKLGVTRVRSLDEMFEALAVFHNRRLPRGDGLAAISVSGGAAGLLSDLALDCGVHFTPLTEQTASELQKVVPEFGNVGNPLDVTGQGVFQTDLLERSLDLLATAPAIDAIVYARSFPAWMDADTPVFRTLEDSLERHPEVPLIPMSLAGGHFMPSNAADTPVKMPVDRVDGMPFLQGAEYGLKAVAAFMRYAAFLRARTTRTSARLSRADAAELARSTIARSSAARLSAQDGSAILRGYGIPLAEEAFAATAEEAQQAAQRIGLPVAVKVEAPSLAHKAKAGGVALGVTTPEQVKEAFARVMRAANDAQGVIVQQMIQDSQVEVIVGMSRDAQFGPVVACGLGGVFVETLRDVQLLLPPVTADETHTMIASLRGAPLLAHADIDALVDVVVRFSELCMDIGSELQAIDLNPLMVRRQGSGVCVVDCLFERMEFSQHGTA
jgi:acetate---CoA ligase (ADP-forming)